MLIFLMSFLLDSIFFNQNIMISPAIAESKIIEIDHNESIKFTLQQPPKQLLDHDMVLIETNEKQELSNVKGSQVTEEKLTLFGRGIVNAKTDDLLMLVCVGDLEKDLSGQRSCDELQFILKEKNKEAIWYSTPFFYGTKKAFNEKIKTIEYHTRGRGWLHPGANQIFGALISFGGAGVIAGVLSVGAGLGFFIVTTIIAVKSKRGYLSIDFLSALPRLVIATRNEDKLLATTDKNGWNWASGNNAVKMRNFKFNDVKYLINHLDLNSMNFSTSD